MLADVLMSAASVRFAVWSNAMLAAACDPDTAARQITAEDVGHQIAGLPSHPDPATLPVALNLLRRAGGRQVYLALPVPGDPVGLAGPPAFNEAALEAGEAVLVGGTSMPSDGLAPDYVVGLVPAYVGPAVQWQTWPARLPPPADLPEADRGLRAALVEAANALAELDVARWNPDVADELIDIRRIGSNPDDALAPGYGPRAVRTAATARRCLAIADAALADDGATIGGSDADARRRTILDLAGAARRALVAACGPPTPA
jgi:hypothetical protein